MSFRVLEMLSHLAKPRHRCFTDCNVRLTLAGPEMFALTGSSCRYTSAKQWLVGHAGRQDDITTHAMASFIAGTVATTICSPADVLKSRIQSSAGSTVRLLVPHYEPLLTAKTGTRWSHSKWPHGRRPKVLDERVDARLAALDVSGMLFAAGWAATDVHQSPHTVLTFAFMEQLRRMMESGRP